ncbi:Shedu immune nuclease family protein [Brevundimonas sp.]
MNTKAFHSLRICAACGAEHRAQDIANHGYGITFREGDKIQVPEDFLKLTANPFKKSIQFTRAGIAVFAEQMFGVSFASRETLNDLSNNLIRLQESNEAFFENAPEFADFDFSDDANAETLKAWMTDNSKSIEWWGMMAAGLIEKAAEAVVAGDAATAVWAAISAERFRALAIFRKEFEEVAHMGNSAGRLIDLLRIWEVRKNDSNEGFWQETFKHHAYAFGQIFSAPASFIEGTAYVGGMKVDRKDARYVDFLLSESLSDHAILVEIKTPMTPLLGSKYRGNAYAPSKDLGGAVVQINDYCQVFREEARTLARDPAKPLRVFNPRRIIVIGNYAGQLSDPKKRDSFEHFRSALNGIDVITFDELFKKVEDLAQLFNIVRTDPVHESDG